MRPVLLSVAVTASLLATGVAAAQSISGYKAKVSVQQPTRLDWVFALANQSPAQPPDNWAAFSGGPATQYEVFVPPQTKSRQPLPMILMISAGDGPTGWNQWQAACKQAGVVFASPYGAGNNCPLQRRVRMVLEVLDDVGRRVPIDPDRTYLAGFSGGARVACSVAFALPEYFGGAIGVCGAEKLREETWLRHRVIDRLSVALITGDADFNRGELEYLRGPILTDFGVRTKVWTVPRMGHAIPDSAQLAETLKWLDEGAADRGKKANDWPAMRIAVKQPPTREQWSGALLKEAQQRLQKPATLYSGLMQLQGLSTRWQDLPAAQGARQILVEYDRKTERPWEADDVAEQRKFLLARARGIYRYSTSELSQPYQKMRNGLLTEALTLWTQVRDDAPDSPAGKEAAQRIAELEKLVADK